MQKNPFMSAWLSAANSYASTGRSIWMAEMHRQQTAMMTDFSKQMARFWTGAWTAQPAPRPASPELGTANLGATIAEIAPASRPEALGNADSQLCTPVARRTAGSAKRTAGPAKKRTAAPAKRNTRAVR
ncbi:hypothetical protein GCM10011504_53890 [Siccirubricoccus deserti]|nr:hypothetical protein GCM10011504_53890 [Siccirubricoccus deserti]